MAKQTIEDLAQEMQSVSARIIACEQAVVEARDKLSASNQNLAVCMDNLNKARKAFDLVLAKIRGEK